MRFSFHLRPLLERGRPDPFGRTFDLCRQAEDLGFDSVATGHHHFTPTAVSDPLMFLAAVAARTTTLRLAQGIYLLSLHHPIRVAEQVAWLDAISGGRATLGVGSGWDPLEFAAFGARRADRGRRMEESLGVVRRLWTEEGVAHDGGFWSFPELTLEPRPVQRPSPPIWVAGSAPRSIDRAARLGDAWLCDPVQTIDAVVDLAALHRQACAAAGTEPAWVLQRTLWIGHDRRELEERWLPGYVSDLVRHWTASTEGSTEAELLSQLEGGTLDPARIAGPRFIGGTPADVIDGVARYREVTGCDHLVVQVYPPPEARTDPVGAFEHTRSMVELFGTHVIPAFR